jgi:hypothetical protein
VSSASSSAADKNIGWFLSNKSTSCTNFTNLIRHETTFFGHFVCPSSAVYSLYTQQWYMSYRFVAAFEQDQDGHEVPSWFCSKAVYKPVWHVPLLSVQWINCWWWTEELSETCRVSWQNRFVKLVHLVGLITKKLVKMHGHRHIKYWMMLTADFSETSVPFYQQRDGTNTKRRQSCIICLFLLFFLIFFFLHLT